MLAVVAAMGWRTDVAIAHEPAGRGPVAPAAKLRKLAKLSDNSKVCRPTAGKARVCAVSGLRLHDGDLWLVMDGPGTMVARARIPRGRHGGADLSGKYVFDVFGIGETARFGGCDAFGDAEAIDFDLGGKLVLSTDRWQVGHFVLAKDGRPRAEACRQYPPQLPSNHGFEAVFVVGETVHAVVENALDGDHRIYSRRAKGAMRESRFRWEVATCVTDKLRITDAAALGDGALLLASCKTWQDHKDYFLGRLVPGPEGGKASGRAQLTYTTRIANPKQRNLEGVAVTDDGRVLVVNDDSRGRERSGSTKLWEVLIPAAQRRALGL